MMAHDKAKAKARIRPIVGEVLRMTSGGVGSLEAEHDSSDQWRKGDVEQTGDFTRGLKVRGSDIC